MNLDEILKEYNPQDILNIHDLDEITYGVAVALHKTMKKVLIANNVKVIKTLNPELEVLICNSAEEFDLCQTLPVGLKVIHCPVLKKKFLGIGYSLIR